MWQRGAKWQLAFVSGKRKKFMQQLGQNRWEPVESLALIPSSQQMKLVDLGVLSLVGSSLPEILGWLEWPPLPVSVII